MVRREDSTGVLGLTAILVRTVSRSSASLRHLAWAIALVGVILVPLLTRVLPFRLAVLPAAPIAAVRDDIPPAVTPTPQSDIRHDVATEVYVYGDKERPTLVLPSQTIVSGSFNGFEGSTTSTMAPSIFLQKEHAFTYCSTRFNLLPGFMLAINP